MKKIAIVDGIRSPFTHLGGALKDYASHQLGAMVTRALIDRTRIDPREIGEVIFGCVNQQSNAPNIARVISLLAQIPYQIPAFSVQRNCASGMQAIVSAYQALALGECDMVLAGGVESMSSSPFVNRDMRFGKKLRHSIMIDTIWEGLTDPICNQLMGETAESLVREFKISRQDQDAFALLSHQRAVKAVCDKKFEDEICSVPLPKKKASSSQSPDLLTCDDGPKRDITLTILSGYRPTFEENGTVTAGNSCPISDGAAGVLMMTDDAVKASGARPMGYIKSYGFAGVEPERMGIGPVEAINIALKKAGMRLDDIDLIELNESFAAQYLACESMLNNDRQITNVNGGSIAIGHPVGATGIRLIITLLHEMRRRGLSVGLAAMCIGGGQGAAIIVERY